MQIHPIRNNQDYHLALARIELLMDAEPDSVEENELDVLATLVEAYEKSEHEILPPDPIEALKYYIESRGLTLRDLESCVGTRARVNEIMNRRRGLTLRMVRKLNNNFGISAEVLIQPYSLLRPTREAKTQTKIAPKSRKVSDVTA